MVSVGRVTNYRSVIPLTRAGIFPFRNENNLVLDKIRKCVVSLNDL